MANKLAPCMAAVLLLAGAPLAAQTDDRHAGYYYPTPTSAETFESKLQPITGIDRAGRVQFITAVAQGTLQAPYRVPYAMFAKGERADRLIIVGLLPGELGTIYRMRALLANLTTQARTSPFFQQQTVAEDATFFDLLKMLGFRMLTVTDGDKLAHQVTIK